MTKLQWENLIPLNDHKSYSSGNTRRQVISKTIYRDRTVLLLRQHRERVSIDGEYKRIPGTFNYAFVILRNDVPYKSEKGHFIFRLPVNLKTIPQARKEAIRIIEADWYSYSGDEQFDKAHKIKLEIEEYRSMTVLKNMPKYMSYFNCDITATNVHIIVNKCVELFDEFENVFTMHNKFIDMQKVYDNEMTAYYKLPEVCRQSAVVVSTKTKLVYPPTQTYDNGYWGDMTYQPAPYSISDNTYGYNPRYVTPPSMDNLNSYRKQVEAKKKLLADKVSSIK